MIAKYSPTYTASDLIASMAHGPDPLGSLRERLAHLHGVRHVLLFESARAALCALLRGLRQADDEIVLPAYNCLAVPEAAARAGWRPLFADIGPGDVNMTAETLARRVSPRTRAVLLTHQFGVPADTGPILDLCRERGFLVIEDAAAALGARHGGRRVGSLGDAAVISFHLVKVVNGGRGGALLTNDDAIAGRVAALALRAPCPGVADLARAFFWWAATRPAVYGVLRRLWGCVRTEPLYQVVRPESRPFTGPLRPCSTWVANLVCRQLDRLDDNVAARQALARRYAAELDGIDGVRLVRPPPDATPAWIQYPIFVGDKEGCYRHLLARGVDLSWTFRYSCAAGYGAGADAPNSERAARTLLGLPTYPSLAPAAAGRICDWLRGFVGQRH